MNSVWCPACVTHPFPVALEADDRQEPPGYRGWSEAASGWDGVSCVASRRYEGTWHAANYETVDRASLLAREYYESVDGKRRDPDVEDIPYIQGGEEGLLEEPDGTLYELQPSFSGNVRLIMRSAFDDFKTACAVGGIKVMKDVCSVILLMHQGV